MVQSLKQKSIHGAELKMEQYTWFGAETEQYTWCRAETKKRRSRTMKDEFFASYLKKEEQYPTEQVD